MARRGNRTGGERSLLECGRQNLVGVSEAGFLAGQRPDADTLLDARATFFDDAIFERPGLVAGKLEINVCGIDGGGTDEAERPFDVSLVEPCGLEDQPTGKSEGVMCKLGVGDGFCGMSKKRM